MPVPVKYFWLKKQKADVIWFHIQSAENVAVHPCSRTAELDHVEGWEKGWWKLVALSPNGEGDMDISEFILHGTTPISHLADAPGLCFPEQFGSGEHMECPRWFTGKWTCRDEDGNAAPSFSLLPQLEKHMQEAARLRHSAIPLGTYQHCWTNVQRKRKRAIKSSLSYFGPHTWPLASVGGISHLPLSNPLLPPCPPPSHASQPLMGCPSGLKPAFPRDDPSRNPGLSSTWADPANWFSCHQGKWHLNEIFINPNLILKSDWYNGAGVNVFQLFDSHIL